MAQGEERRRDNALEYERQNQREGECIIVKETPCATELPNKSRSENPEPVVCILQIICFSQAGTCAQRHSPVCANDAGLTGVTTASPSKEEKLHPHPDSELLIKVRPQFLQEIPIRYGSHFFIYLYAGRSAADFSLRTRRAVLMVCLVK